ncbi:hypothetical protein ACOTJQ_29020 [Achromobacter xylosoxidans]|uniref:hypothetical protein n=1 Tax=Achromobacter ruhlandii TaxID=72557 RepID=UPI003B9D2898
MVQRDVNCLMDEFQRDQSWIAAAYAEYLQVSEGVQYSELEAAQALESYLRTDVPRYAEILERLRPLMDEMRRQDRVITISWEA